MTRLTLPGSVITRSSRCGTAAGALPKTPIFSRSTCLMVPPLLSKAFASLPSIALRCLPAPPLTPLPLTSSLLDWAIPTVWFQLVFALVIHHLQARTNSLSLSIALLPAASR
jgi:hypothetical protein